MGFSHWSHRLKYTCRVCHFELDFAMEVNGSGITEAANRAGRFCGACHDGETAFGFDASTCSRCHTGRGGPSGDFKALKNLPKTAFGNKIDWVQAVKDGQIAPARSIFEEDYEPIAFTKELLLEAEWVMISPAVFPHEAHQQWLDCANCHPDIFNIKRRPRNTSICDTTSRASSAGCVICALPSRWMTAKGATRGCASEQADEDGAPLTKVLVVGLALYVLVPSSGAAEVDDQIRSACRWIDAEETISTTLLTRVTGSDGKVGPVEGVSSGCAIVLECLLEARSGFRDRRDDGPTDSASADPASVCWRVVDIEQLSKETIDRMLSHVDGLAEDTAAGEGADSDVASCGRFLRCLSRSGIGTTEDRSWREEFARICAMTDVAGTLSREELQVLVDDSERLLDVLENLSAREAKVYNFRLKMCRDLFIFSLQVLESDTPGSAPPKSPDLGVPVRSKNSTDVESPDVQHLATVADSACSGSGLGKPRPAGDHRVPPRGESCSPRTTGLPAPSLD